MDITIKKVDVELMEKQLVYLSAAIENMSDNELGYALIDALYDALRDALQN
jgi:hypothetical protein